LVFASRAADFTSRQRSAFLGIAVKSDEKVIEEPVQGVSHCVGVRTVVGMEASAANERVDFALAQFDREAPQLLSSPLAVQTHALGAGESAHAGWQGSGCRGVRCH
jgi:hypothetical protein